MEGQPVRPPSEGKGTMEGQSAGRMMRPGSNELSGRPAPNPDISAASATQPQASGSSWTGYLNRRIGNGAKIIAKQAIGGEDQSPPGERSGADPEEFEVDSRQRKSFSQQELCNVAYKMSKGLEIKDRFWRLIPFKQCFIGEEAVRWLVKEGYAADVNEALAIGNGIHDLGLLEHVTKDHKFKNCHLFYRFSLDCMSETATVDSEAKADSANRAAIKEQADMVFLHAAHIHKLQRRLSDVSSDVELLQFSISALVEAAGPNQRALEAMHAEIKRLQAFVAVLCFAFAGMLLLQSAGGAAAYVITATAMAMGAVMLHSKLAAHPRLQGVQTAVPVLKSRASTQEMATSSSPIKAAEGLARLSRISNAPGSPSGEHAYGVVAGGSVESTEAGNDFLPSMEEIKASPDYPLLLRLKLDLPYQRITDSTNPRSIPINRSGSFAFETDLFEGHAMLWVVGLPSSPPGLFKGRQRRTSLVVQGRFKQQLPYDDVFTGQEFFRPLLDMPAKWMINVLLRIARKLSPSSIFGLLDAPHILTPLVAGAQNIHITPAGSGEDPPDLDAPPHEDMRAVAANGTEAQMTSVQRKKWFSSAKNRQDRLFDTENTYTFHFWQHLLDLSTYELDMGVAQFNIAANLDGQPLQLMVKQQSTGAYLWNFEAWHENLVSATTASQ